MNTWKSRHEQGGALGQVKSKNREKDKGESSGEKSAGTLLRVDRKDFSPEVERDKRQGTRDRGKRIKGKGN
jgi:hypothetical protein